MMDERCQTLPPHYVQESEGRSGAREMIALFKANSGGGDSFWVFFFFLFIFFNSSLRKTICLGAMSGVLLIALCGLPAASNLLQPAALFRPGALSSLKEGESSMASHFNKLATVFTLQVRGLDSLVFQEIPRILMVFKVGGF